MPMSKMFYKFIAGFLSIWSLGIITSVTDSIMNKDEFVEKNKDADKLNGDWSKVGSDISKSYEQFKSEYSK